MQVYGNVCIYICMHIHITVGRLNGCTDGQTGMNASRQTDILSQIGMMQADKKSDRLSHREAGSYAGIHSACHTGRQECKQIENQRDCNTGRQECEQIVRLLMQADRQKCKQRDRQIDCKTSRKAATQAVSQKDCNIGRQKYKKINSQIDYNTGRQTEMPADRQSEYYNTDRQRGMQPNCQIVTQAERQECKQVYSQIDCNRLESRNASRQIGCNTDTETGGNTCRQSQINCNSLGIILHFSNSVHITKHS